MIQTILKFGNNVFKSFIPIALSIIGIEYGSRIIIYQPITTSWAKLHKNGLITNLENHYAIHNYWGDIETIYFFGNFANRISKDEYLNIKNSNNLNNRNSCKYLVMGDSYTFGWLVDYKDAFPTVIQDTLNKEFQNKIKFINVGTGGWGLADYSSYIETYKQALIKENLRGIIVFVNADDAARAAGSNLYKVKQYGKNFSIDKSNKIFYSRYGLIKRFISNKFIAPFYNWSLRKFNVARILKHRFLDGYIIKKPSDIVSRKNARLKKRLEQKVSKKHIAIIKHSISDLLHITGEVAPLNLVQTGSRAYKNLTPINKYFFSQKGQDFLKSQELRFDFSTIREENIYDESGKIKYDGHPNEFGHSQISKNILKSKSKNSLKNFIRSTCK